MADLLSDGMFKVSFVPTILNVGAPKVTELSAVGAISLEGSLSAEGLNISSETADIDTSKLNSTTNSGTIGRDTYTVSVTYVRDDGLDTARTAVETALIRGATGYLVVRRNKVSTAAWTIGDKVEVYPVICKRPNPSAPAPDSSQSVEVGMAITDGLKVRATDNPGLLVA